MDGGLAGGGIWAADGNSRNQPPRDDGSSAEPLGGGKAIGSCFFKFLLFRRDEVL